MHTIATQSFSDRSFEVQINQPNSKINTISSQVLYAFSLLLDEIAENREIRAVVFRSAKPNCFIAGADINELRTLKDPKMAEAFVTDGQHLLNRIAAIHLSASQTDLEQNARTLPKHRQWQLNEYASSACEGES